MKSLKYRILKDAKRFEGVILKVDSFINHQISSLDSFLLFSIQLQTTFF